MIRVVFEEVKSEVILIGLKSCYKYRFPMKLKVEAFMLNIFIARRQMYTTATCIDFRKMAKEEIAVIFDMLKSS